MGHHRHPPVPGEGDHLGDADAIGLATGQGILQTLDADRREVHQLSPAAESGEVAAQGGGAGEGGDHQHGIGIGSDNLPGCGGGIGGVALYAGNGHGPQAVAGKGGLAGTQPIFPIGILDMHHRHLVAAVPHQVVDHLIDLRLVAGPHVEHHGAKGFQQGPRPGSRSHKGNPNLLHQGKDCLGVRRAENADQGDGLLLLNQPARIAQGELGVVAVIQAHQAQPPAMDAAAPVHLGKPGEQALLVILGRLGRGPAEGGRLADHQLPGAAGRHPRRRGRAHQQGCEQG